MATTLSEKVPFLQTQRLGISIKSHKSDNDASAQKRNWYFSYSQTLVDATCSSENSFAAFHVLLLQAVLLWAVRFVIFLIAFRPQDSTDNTDDD